MFGSRNLLKSVLSILVLQSLLATNTDANVTKNPSLGRAVVEKIEVESLSAFKPILKPKAPVIVTYSKEYIDLQPNYVGNAQWRCLAEALYFEARGEPVAGQFAVAEVILNRRDSRRFPNTVCGVVNQGTGKKYQCQFSYTCDGIAENISERKAWLRVGKVARLILAGAPRKLTHGATHYHTNAVNPNWARVFPKTASIGVHYFYRMPKA